MNTAYILLYLLVTVGIVFLPLLWWGARSQTVRKVFLVLSLLVLNLGMVLILLAVFLVSRLEGSTPPGFLQVLQVFWLPVLVILIIDAAIVLINSKVKARLERSL